MNAKISLSFDKISPVEKFLFIYMAEQTLLKSKLTALFNCAADCVLKSFHWNLLERTFTLESLASGRVTAFFCRCFFFLLMLIVGCTHEVHHWTQGHYICWVTGWVGGWMGRWVDWQVDSLIAICLRCQICWHLRARRTCNRFPPKMFFAKLHPMAVSLGFIQHKQYLLST